MTHCKGPIQTSYKPLGKRQKSWDSFSNIKDNTHPHALFEIMILVQPSSVQSFEDGHVATVGPRLYEPLWVWLPEHNGPRSTETNIGKELRLIGVLKGPTLRMLLMPGLQCFAIGRVFGGRFRKSGSPAM